MLVYIDNIISDDTSGPVSIGGNFQEGRIFAFEILSRIIKIKSSSGD